MNFMQRLLFTDRAPAPVPFQAKGMGSSAVTPLIAKFFGTGFSAFFSTRKALDFQEATRLGYNGQVWVRRCIEARASAVASVPWKVGRKNKDATITPIPGHPLEILLRKPNPHTDGSEFFRRWMIHLDLAGNAYWEKVFVKDRSGVGGGFVPKQLFPIRPDWVTPKPDPQQYLLEYTIDTKTESKPQTLKPAEVLHFQYVDPLNPFVGSSPLTAAASTMAAENAAVTWNQTLLDNYAIPSGILKIPGQALEDVERDKIQEEVDAEFTGENRHKPMVLWGGMEWEQLGLSQQDAQFLEQKRLNKYEICAILGVPPNIIGANENPTYSNYGISRLSFWEDTIIPLLQWLQNKINAQLAIYWGEDIVVEYDISNVPAFRDAFAQKVDAAQKLLSMMIPLNDVNRRLGLGFEEYPWGNTAWIPMNTVSVEDAAAPPPPGVTAPMNPDDPNYDPTQDPNSPEYDPSAVDSSSADVPPSSVSGKLRRRIAFTA